MAQISVVIIDSDTDSINSMVKYMKSLDNIVTVEGVATSFDSGFELIHKKKPMVVILEVGDDIGLSIERIIRYSIGFLRYLLLPHLRIGHLKQYSRL